MANFAGFGSFGGVNIYESLLLTIPVEDWSAVRSPGRARRRRAALHPSHPVSTSNEKEGA